MMSYIPTIGWGWWIVLHIIAIALLLYWGAALRQPNETENNK